MFRQMVKLDKARRAQKAGHWEEALELSRDPEIRDHVKAEAIKKEAVAALKGRADTAMAEGRLDAAEDVWKVIARFDPESDARPALERIAKKRHEGEEIAARIRATYFKARLELERGETLRAADLLRCIPEADRTAEATELLKELEGRLAKGAELVEEARELLRRDPDRAFETIERAAAMDPKNVALPELRLEAARSRISGWIAARLPDEVFGRMVLEHGMYKRRVLGGVAAGEIARLDAPLRDEFRGRILERKAAGDLDAVKKLIDRQRDAVGLDADIAAISRACAGIEEAKDQLRRGNFDIVEKELAEIAANFGSEPAFTREIARIRATLADLPKLEAEAHAFLRDGDLELAKRRFQEILDRLPYHRDARTALSVVEKRLAEQEQAIRRCRDLMARRRWDEARAVLYELEAARCVLGDFSELKATFAKESGRTDVPSAPDTPKTERRFEPSGSRLPSAPDGADRRRSDAAVAVESVGAEVGSRWILSVEEHGEYVVFENDVVEFGNAVKRVADILVLAPIASKHARIVRSFSFHGGQKYSIEATDGNSVSVNDVAVTTKPLSDGDRVRFGREFAFTFRLPSSRSKAAVVEFDRGFEFEGSRRMILLPPGGRSGAVVVSDQEGAHVPTRGALGTIEIFREKSGSRSSLVAQSNDGFRVGEVSAERRIELLPDVPYRSNELCFFVRRPS